MQGWGIAERSRRIQSSSITTPPPPPSATNRTAANTAADGWIHPTSGVGITSIKFRCADVAFIILFWCTVLGGWRGRLYMCIWERNKFWFGLAVCLSAPGETRTISSKLNIRGIYECIIYSSSLYDFYLPPTWMERERIHTCIKYRKN